MAPGAALSLMRAVVVHRPGSYNQLRLEDRPSPWNAPGEPFRGVRRRGLDIDLAFDRGMHHRRRDAPGGISRTPPSRRGVGAGTLGFDVVDAGVIQRTEAVGAHRDDVGITVSVHHLRGQV